MKQTLREGQHLFLTTASISLFTNTNIMLVGLIAGNVQAGYFGVADKLARATSGFVYPVVQAAYPRAVRLLTESKEGFLSLLYKILLYGGLFSAVAATLTFLLTHEIGLAAFGKEIPAALVVIRVASLFPLIGTLSLIVGTLALIPLGFEKAQSRLLLGAGIFNVLIASVLIFYDGALGGVIGMVATETLVLVGSVAILSWRGAAFLPWSIRAQLS
jgi:O-antigen/teichoic acid export membrane protein